MTDVMLLIDNDVVIKLAQMGVYREGIESVGVKVNQVGSTELMLNFMTRAATTSSLRLTPNEQDRLKAALSTITEIDLTTDESRLAAAMMKAIMLAALDIQEGELLLMAVALKRDGTRVATGDKRALRELPQLATACPDLVRLKGRCFCFEQIIRKVCQLHGLPRARTAIMLARHADAAVTKLYDTLSSSGAEVFRRGLAAKAAAIAPGWLAKI